MSSRSSRAEQTDFGGVSILSAEAAGGTVTLEVEVGAVPTGSATGELVVTASQVGNSIGSVRENITQTENRAVYEVFLPVTPQEGFEAGNVSVEVLLREGSTTVDRVSTSVELNPKQDPPEGAPSSPGDDADSLIADPEALAVIGGAGALGYFLLRRRRGQSGNTLL